VRAIAHALGGHCTSLRRTAVGPFGVTEAAAVDEVALLSVRSALARLPDEALDRVPEAVRGGVLAVEDRT
jgi:tRNA U55 pseudouridine synthase TruB